MVIFPNEGKCEGVHEDLIDFLKRRPNANITVTSKTVREKATGVAWNSLSWWFVVNLENSTKPPFNYNKLKTKFFKPKEIELW